MLISLSSPLSLLLLKLLVLLYSEYSDCHQLEDDYNYTSDQLAECEPAVQIYDEKFKTLKQVQNQINHDEQANGNTNDDYDDKDCDFDHVDAVKREPNHTNQSLTGYYSAGGRTHQGITTSTDEYIKKISDILTKSDYLEESGWPIFYQNSCGRATLNRLHDTVSSGYITRGIDSQPGQWPFAAFILEHDHLICTAVIVTQYHLLTAHHCMEQYMGDFSYRQKIKILVGTHVRPVVYPPGEYNPLDQESKALAEYRVINYLKHKSADIGWIITQEKIEFNNHVQPACFTYESTKLPPTSGPTSRCYIIGSGVDSKPEGRPNKYVRFMRVELQDACQVQKHEEPLNQCYKDYPGQNRPRAGPGDSGAPLVCLNERLKRWFLLGVHQGMSKFGWTIDRIYTSSRDDSFARSTNSINWPVRPSMPYCDPNVVGSTVCKVQTICGRGNLKQKNAASLVQIDQVEHDAVKEVGSPCPGTLISSNLVLTSWNCSAAMYNSIRDVAPLNSFRVRFGLKFIDVDKLPVLQNHRRTRRQSQSPRDESIGSSRSGISAENWLKVNEIYIIGDRPRALILLRLERELEYNRGLDPICWPYERDMIDWSQCLLIHLVPSDHTEEYPVAHVECPENPKDTHHSIKCFQFKTDALKTNNTSGASSERNLWIGGSPIYCLDHVNRTTLVAVVTKPFRGIGLVTLVDETDLKVSSWEPENIRGVNPWAKKLF